MGKRLIAFTLMLAGWLALLAPAVAAPAFPELTGRVTDAAMIMRSEDVVRIANKLETLEQQTGRQVVVATVPSLQDYDIADYGYQLGRHWQIGRKGLNDGAILIVAPNERKVRIEVGYGLEGVLTDGLSSLIIREQIVPKFKEGDMTAGIEAGTDAIIAQLQLPPEEAQRLAKEADAQAEGGDGIGILFFILGIFLFIGFIIWIIARASRTGRRYAGGGAPVTVWGNSGGDSGCSGGFDSGGSDFSGGGGDFGGGGASGDW